MPGIILPPWRRPRPQIEVLPSLTDHAVVRVIRGREIIEELAVVRPNEFHAAVYHAVDDVWEDVGVSHNLRTTVGLDWEAQVLGGLLPGSVGSPATATSATSLTVTGTPLVANALKGMVIIADNGTSAPTWANIGSNTTSVITVDAWSNGTPGATAAFTILPGGMPARYVGITTDTGAPAAGDTTLASEETTNGLTRALATYAHTGGVSSYTQAITFTYTGSTLKTIHKAGAFTASTNTAGGIMVFETLLSNDASVNASGDAIAGTWTVNI
jgi:hypothetical protein